MKNKLLVVLIFSGINISIGQKKYALGVDPTQNLTPILLKYKGFTKNIMLRFNPNSEVDSVFTNEISIGFSKFKKLNIKTDNSNFNQINHGFYLTYNKFIGEGWGYGSTVSVTTQRSTIEIGDFDFEKSITYKFPKEAIFSYGLSLFKEFNLNLSRRLSTYPRLSVSIAVSSNPKNAPYTAYLAGLGVQSPKILFTTFGFGISCPVYYSFE